MRAVLTADIINSTNLQPEIWMEPLKKLLKTFGEERTAWEIYRGDEIQLLLQNASDSFYTAILLKTELKKVDSDVRISIGLGTVDFLGENIKEHNGSAFQYSGRNLDELKNSSQTLGIKSDCAEFDENFNLIFKLLEGQFEKWKSSTATSLSQYFQHHEKKQTEIADQLGITQGAFSRALKRGGLENIQETDAYFRKKIGEIS